MEDFDSQLNRIEKLLDQYERNVGLPAKDKYVDQATRYFNMSRDQLEALSIEDCAHGSYILNNMALHIQRTINREIARSNWTKGQIKYYISDKVQQYRGSWDHQEMQAIKADTFASKLFRLQGEISLRIDRLSFISNNVRQLSESLTNLQRAKSGTKNG